ncbi:PilW family protein [Roseateles sp.]|uniref:PilW family protein n=1 Tax=Roseateles sp. TaxID=1971397 RepID=UPI003BA7048C
MRKLIDRNSRSKNRGISLIELMVGITVGMVVVAGASLMMTGQLADHRRLMLETQVQQDLRAAADLMLRDLRRSGSWAVPMRGVWSPSPNDPAPLANAYATSTLTQTQTGPVLEYSYSRHQDRLSPVNPPAVSPEDNTVNSSTERFGFKLEGGILKFRLGDVYQPLTDPNTLRITAFNVVMNEQTLPLLDYCSKPCEVGNANCPPQQKLRRFDILLTGQAAHDANVVRTLRLSSRMRNDQIVGSCE